MGLILSLLTVVSLLVRGFSISSLPPELFGDEIDVGYQAFSLLHTGRDLYGQLFPTYIHSLSEWRTPMLMYYTVPTISIFGNTELGVRLPEVILGAVAPLILFLLVYQVSKNRSVALLSSIILAILPWHILYSRAAFESVLLLDFILLGTLLFIKQRYFVSLLLFFLTPYIYSTASLFTPLWLLALTVLYRPKLPKTSFLLLIVLVPFGLSLLSGQAAERFGKVGLFSNPEIIDQLTRYRTDSKSPLERLFSNRPVFIATRIYSNYLSAFSPEFLFIRGDNTARQSLQYIGELLPVFAPFLALGLIYLVKQKQYLWLVWLLLAPLPSALTYDGAYHATRLFMMISSLCVAVGSGIYWLVKSMPRYAKAVVYVAIWGVIFFQFTLAANYYLIHYPLRTWQWWHVGFKQAMEKVGELSDQYHQVFINNSYEPSLIRFLFYTRYPPSQFHANFTVDKPSDISAGYYGFYLAPKYYFGGFSPPPNKSLVDVIQPGNLYVVSQRDDVPGDWDWSKNPPGGVKVLFTTRNPLGTPIFYLVTKN